MNMISLLITLVIALFLWLTLMPGIHLDKNQHSPGVEQKTIEQVNQVENQTQQQVDYARQMQQKEQNSEE